MKKTMTIFGAILFASFILTSCGGETKDCMASTQEELEICLKDKPVSDLATFYCKWSKIEADSKDQNDTQKRKEADNHTNAIEKIVLNQNAAYQAKFKELTIGCEDFSSRIQSSTESTESGVVVTIGSQVWASKNLDVATYRNGDVIPQVQDKEAWESLNTGAWCYYDNDTSNGTKYGKLYNWYAVNDPRGLAPNGYHISTNEEWEILIDYLGGDVEAGTKMKSTNKWADKGNFNGINISGFSGLPGGRRDKHGIFDYIGDNSDWWSSKENDTDNAGGLGLTCYDGKVSVYIMEKRYGHSVRCLKD